AAWRGCWARGRGCGAPSAEDVSLPQGVAGLKTNFFVNGLLELLRPVGEAGLTCALCPLIGQEDGRPAVSRCLGCTDSLCQTCAAGHRCSRLTHAHRLASLQGYLSGEHDEEIRQRQAVRAGWARTWSTPARRWRRRPRVAELLAGVEETAGRAALEEVLAALRRHVEGREKAAGLLRTKLELQEQLARGTADVTRKVLALGRPVEIVSLEALISQRLGRLRGFRWEPLGGPRPRLVIHAELQSLSGLFQLDLGEAKPDGQGEESGQHDAPAPQPPAPAPRPPAPAPQPPAPCPAASAVPAAPHRPILLQLLGAGPR
ncbi:unnamed protein product, partial [Lepidochelys kempii]